MYRIILFWLVLAGTNAAQADTRVFEVVEHAAEVMELQLGANAQQLIYAQRCDECPTLALSLDKRTRIYDGRTPVTLSRAAGYLNRGGTIFFDPQTRVITRIVFWPVVEQTS